LAGKIVRLAVVSVLFCLAAGCKPEATVETRVTKKTPESYSFMSRSTRLMILPVFTGTISDMSGMCTYSEDMEEFVKASFSRLGVVSFNDYCMTVSGDKGMRLLVALANRYYENGVVDSADIAEVIKEAPVKPTHVLFAKIDNIRAWKDMKGKSHLNMILAGLLYDVGAGKSVFEFVSAGKTEKSGNKEMLAPQELTRVLLRESAKQLPYDPSRAYKDASAPDF